MAVGLNLAYAKSLYSRKIMYTYPHSRACSATFGRVFDDAGSEAISFVLGPIKKWRNKYSQRRNIRVIQGHKFFTQN